MDFKELKKKYTEIPPPPIPPAPKIIREPGILQIILDLFKKPKK